MRYRNRLDWLRPLLLEEPKEGVEQHDRQDGQRVGPLARQAGEQRGNEQDPDDQFLELAEELLPEGGWRGLRQLVVAVARPTLRDLSIRQSALRIGAE